MKKYHIQIIGGGLVGLTTALSLSKLNLKILLIDKNDNPNNNSDSLITSALMPSSINLLKNLDIWKDLKNKSYPLEKIQLISVKNNKAHKNITFNAHDINKKALAYNISNYQFKKILCEKINLTKNITHLYNTSIDKISYKDNNIISSSKEQLYKSKLLLGCDGKNSKIRELSGILGVKKNLNQYAMVFNIKHTNHNNFTSKEFMHANGAMTFIPTAQNQSAVIWIEKDETIIKQLLKNKTAFVDELCLKSDNYYKDIILETEVKYFPLNTLNVKSFIAQNIALIGESAHGLTPVGAQGLNLSFRDIAFLYDEIKKDSLLENISSILKNYNNLRKADVYIREKGTDIFNKISRSTNPIINTIKSYSFDFLNKTDFSKKLLINFCMSYPGKTPTLMNKTQFSKTDGIKND